MGKPDKVETLLGFAIKAGKVVFGTDRIEAYRKKIYLIIMCETLSENGKNKIRAMADKVKVLQSTEKKVEEMTHRIGCKVIAVVDRQFAGAIEAAANGTYRLVTTEVK